MSRGVLYIVWGRYNRAELQRSIDSLRSFGYDYHVAEIEDIGIGLAHKAHMADLSPFDTTLFLDTDTIAMNSLDYGFEMAEKHSLACCIAPASSAHLAAKHIGMALDYDLPQYNTGVIFFRKGIYDNQPLGLFNRWKQLCDQYPMSSKNDQPAFSQAVSLTINPYILPRTWNYRCRTRYEAHTLHGHVKIKHCR